MKPTILFQIILFQAVLILLLRPSLSQQQPPQGPQTLFETLSFSAFPVCTGLCAALFPTAIIVAQTPVQVHYTFATAIAGHEVNAACHPKCLSFFGFKATISTKLCNDKDLKITTQTLTYYYVLASLFPSLTSAGPILPLLKGVGINPFINRRNLDTPQGWATKASAKIITYLENDGWNSRGKTSSVLFPKRYGDTTNYQPVNRAHWVKYPLRWQPLTYSKDGYGDFAIQEHVTPHIGQTVKPLSMSLKAWNELSSKSPYENPNKFRKMSAADKLSMKSKQIPDLLERMREPALNENKLFRSYWWDAKFLSLALISGYYEAVNGLPVESSYFFALGENMAFHDAVLLAWREKRKHDLARPVTIMKQLYGPSRKFWTWRGISRKPGFVKMSEWEPVVETMPHSEFPSASAVMCASVLGYVERQLNYNVQNFTDRGYTITFPDAGIGGFTPLKGSVTVKFKDIEELVKDCGDSRLWSGLHFKPSVEVGEGLGRSVGRSAFETYRDIYEGRKPQHCHWCVDE